MHAAFDDISDSDAMSEQMLTEMKDERGGLVPVESKPIIEPAAGLLVPVL